MAHSDRIVAQILEHEIHRELGFLRLKINATLNVAVRHLRGVFHAYFNPKLVPLQLFTRNT